MQTVKSLLDCKDREQNRRETEHDRNISVEEVGRQGKWDKKATESKHHEKIEKVAAYYVAYQDVGLVLTNCRKAGSKFRKRCAKRC